MNTAKICYYNFFKLFCCTNTVTHFFAEHFSGKRNEKLLNAASATFKCIFVIPNANQANQSELELREMINSNSILHQPLKTCI